MEQTIPIIFSIIVAPFNFIKPLPIPFRWLFPPQRIIAVISEILFNTVSKNFTMLT